MVCRPVLCSAHGAAVPAVALQQQTDPWAQQIVVVCPELLDDVGWDTTLFHLLGTGRLNL